jgi:hypothetical protein
MVEKEEGVLKEDAHAKETSPDVASGESSLILVASPENIVLKLKMIPDFANRFIYPSVMILTGKLAEAELLPVFLKSLVDKLASLDEEARGLTVGAIELKVGRLVFVHSEDGSDLERITKVINEFVDRFAKLAAKHQ